MKVCQGFFCLFFLYFKPFSWFPGSEIDIGRDSRIGEPNSNSWLVTCDHFHTNTFGKYISLLPTQLCINQQGRLGSVVLHRNHSKRRKTMNSKLWKMQWETTLLAFPRSHDNSQINKTNLWKVRIAYILKEHGNKKVCILLASISQYQRNFVDNIVTLTNVFIILLVSSFLKECGVIFR